MTEQPNTCPNCGDDHSAVEELKQEFNLMHGLSGLAANESGLALAAVAVFLDPTAAFRVDTPADALHIIGAAGYADPFHLDAALLARVLRDEADRVEANAAEFDANQAAARTEIERYQAGTK